MSVSVPEEVIIVNAPLAGTNAEYHTSPSLLPPSQATSGTAELVAPEFEPAVGVHVAPTVNASAVQGSSFWAVAYVLTRLNRSVVNTRVREFFIVM